MESSAPRSGENELLVLMYQRMRVSNTWDTPDDESVTSERS
jgi:hypothetical protein